MEILLSVGVQAVFCKGADVVDTLAYNPFRIKGGNPPRRNTVKEKGLFTTHEVTDVFNVQPSPCTLKEKIFSLRLLGEIVFLGWFFFCLRS